MGTVMDRPQVVRVDPEYLDPRIRRPIIGEVYKDDSEDTGTIMVVGAVYDKGAAIEVRDKDTYELLCIMNIPRHRWKILLDDGMYLAGRTQIVPCV